MSKNSRTYDEAYFFWKTDQTPIAKYIDETWSDNHVVYLCRPSTGMTWDYTDFIINIWRDLNL